MIPYVTADNAKKIAQEVKEEDSKIKIHRFKYYSGETHYVTTKEVADEIVRKYCSGYLIMDQSAEGEGEEFSDGTAVYTPTLYDNTAAVGDSYLIVSAARVAHDTGTDIGFVVKADGKLEVQLSEL